MKRIRPITTEPLSRQSREENHGLSKFMTRGKEKARKKSLLIASVQNLKRLIRFCKRKLPNKRDIQKTLVPLMQYETFSYNSNYCFV